MASWELLDEKGESELHKSRLLNVEEKPFKRITKRLASISTIVSGAIPSKQQQQQQQAIPNGHQSPSKTTSSSGPLQEDLTLDFAAFDSSIARLQFLHDANLRERDRYEADKQRILAECQAARENNVRLREQLEGAQVTLAQRKKFDELAEKIISNRMLRPREDQFAALAKLEDECKELERESETYSETWKERRDQFNRIMEEGMLLRRQIRDEKEEVDRREGMNEDAADDEADEPRGGGQTPGLDPSGTGTPRPDGGEGGSHMRNDGGGGGGGGGGEDSTPVPLQSNGSHADTPSRDSLGPGSDTLKVPAATGAASSFLSHSESRASTREPSAPPQHEESGNASDEDVNMDDGAKAGDEDDNTAPLKNGDKMEVDN